MAGRLADGMSERPFTPRALGEIAVRCRDHAAMVAFYEDTLSLTRLRPGERGGHREGIVFFRLGESYAGHIAVLALFADGATGEPEDGMEVAVGQQSSLHHLALSLPWDEQDVAVRWLEASGCDVRVQDFAWTGWRGVFTRDPDGNTVELVAADPAWHLT